MATTVSGARIREARHRAGMTQEALARATGASERNIVRWENDKHTPRADTLAQIAEATGQEIAFFYADLGEAAPEGGRFPDEGGPGGPAGGAVRRAR